LAAADAGQVPDHVQTLLQQMQDKFQTMSDQIIGRNILPMRIDDLEKNISDLMTQAGLEGNDQHHPILLAFGAWRVLILGPVYIYIYIYNEITNETRRSQSLCYFIKALKRVIVIAVTHVHRRKQN
uniref:Heat shock factor-binding protein 1 n=1 Tax=Sinocyclocheilus rhinocerous TaxID=307959 RepID=A0A673G3Y4_9TELE